MLSSTGSTTNFESFPNLPPELRTKIYEYCLPGPQTVPVRFSSSKSTYYTPSSQSTLLAISRETRSFYLSYYNLLLFSPAHDSVIYVDPAIDTLLFDSLECSPDGELSRDLRECNMRGEIQRVAIDTNLWEVMRIFRVDCLSEIRVLPSLKTLALVLRRDYPERDSEPRAGAGRGQQGIGTLLWDNNDDNTIFGTPGVGTVSTVEQEIRQVHWYVNSVRWELDQSLEMGLWKEGKTPNVQMWLW